MENFSKKMSPSETHNLRSAIFQIPEELEVQEYGEHPKEFTGPRRVELYHPRLIE
jgi:hypothetical protein